MNRIYFLSGALVVTLVMSYTTWTSGTRDAGGPGAQVPIYSGTQHELEAIRWSSDALKVDIEEREDEQGTYRWVIVTETVDPNQEEEDPFAHTHPDDPEEDPEEHPEEHEGEEGAHEHHPLETLVTAFLGNDAALKAWESFGPLHALRQLSETGDPSIFGFEEGSTQLTIARTHGEIDLTVGAETYGSKDRFVKRGDDVFLVDDALFRPLLHPKTHLVERRLFPMTETDLTRVVVRADGGQVAYVQRHKDDRAKAFWALESAQDDEAQDASLWFGKMLRMRLKAYVTGADPEGMKEAFSFTVASGDQAVDVQIYRADGEEEKEIFYARSSFSRSLVELTGSLAADVVDDLASVLN